MVIESTIFYEHQIIKPVLPLNYQDAPDFFKDGTSYDLPRITRYKLKNVFIFPNGLIYTPKLFPESIVYKGFLENYPPIYHPIQIVKDFLKRRIKVLPNEKYLTLFDEWSSNDYHFQVDILPRLLSIDTHTLTLLLPDTPYCRESVPALLKLFNFNFKNILYINNITFVQSCVFISKVAISGYSNPELMQQLKKE